MRTLHATAVARRTRAGPLAVLLLGPSGAGKSELALRLIAAGWLLVADDRVAVTATASGLTAEAPPSIAGRIEARGVGILRVPFLHTARLVLAVDLAAPAERLPEPRRWSPPGAPPIPESPSIPYIGMQGGAPASPLRLEAAFAQAIAGWES